MIQILVGTDRPESRSLEVAEYIEPLYKAQGMQTNIMKLADLELNQLEGRHYSEEKPKKVQKAVEALLAADGLVVICPEYNGSMPGVLKLFIDHWKYPDSFEHRPVCFIGLGGQFGGLRPVEHLQQVFGYRNGFIFPDRVFMQNVWGYVADNKITDERVVRHLDKQAQGFCRFIKALKSEKLHGGDYKREK